MTQDTPLKSINWLDSTSRAISAKTPSIASNASYVTERLAALLFQRLDEELSERILSLLPASILLESSPLLAARGGADRSIGYTDFIERARHTIGISHGPEANASEDLYRHVADEFLWAFAHELPAEIKTRLTEQLPLELRSRMNLYNASIEEARVA